MDSAGFSQLSLQSSKLSSHDTPTLTASVFRNIQPVKVSQATSNKPDLNNSSAPPVKIPIRCDKDFQAYFQQREGLSQNYIDVIASVLNDAGCSAAHEYKDGFLHNIRD